MTNALTLWVDTITGERLDRTALDDRRQKAHELFEANGAIFEDELEALNALGVVSSLQVESVYA